MLDKVLLIDDDEITLMICEMAINSQNFARETIKLVNGQDGIAYFDKLEIKKKNGLVEKAPDLILLDLNMPIMNGWEFLEEFTNKYGNSFPDVKVCILTSSVDPLDLTHSKIFNNVIGFINKPLTAERVNELKENESLEDFFN